ncbi:hypothetical protein CTAYLR_007248 [Chrysophaeum taylorii]|uniref:PSI-F n=1 Tax=Chrysophaeum taylorii TaxID=2483200 RepID=A0AAD7UCR1_9STRA|nr:hypothetical protein CTAYLR_007248 [Chrysophaeum taylorii]
MTLLIFVCAMAAAMRPTADPVRRSLVLAPATAAVPNAVVAIEKPGEKLDEATVKKYKAIYSAKEKMPKKAQEGYMKKVCDSGVLGPSILGFLLCSSR